MCLVGASVAQAEPQAEFRILVAKVGKHPNTSTAVQTIATATEHHFALMESPITYGEVLGIAVENLYRKRTCNIKAGKVINTSLARNSQQNFGAKEETYYSGNHSIFGRQNVPWSLSQNVDKAWHDALWKTLANQTSSHFSSIWSQNHNSPNPPHTGQEQKAGIRNNLRLAQQFASAVIESVNSACASVAFFARKKDDSLWFCIDYRKVNSVTVKLSYLIPRMGECIDSLGHAKVFSTLNEYSGHWKIQIKPEDGRETAFTFHAGTYQSIWMTFDLANEANTFQRALDLILFTLNWKICLIYLEDVIIYSNSIKEHIHHVAEIFTAVKEAGVNLKIRKCSFFSDSVECIG